MELKYLKTFITILENDSFQSAAKQLNYTQSTITFQIQQLEESLSIKLFEKIGRKMILTEAGKDIVPYVKSILESVERLEHYSKKELKGTLKISMPESLLTYKIQPLLKIFHEQAPHVRLSIETLNCYKIRNEVINGGSDIALHYDVGGYSSSVIREDLADYSLCLFASSALEEMYCDFISEKQHKPLCLITNDRESIFQKLIDNYLEEKEIIMDRIMDLGSIEAIKQSVISNLGIAYLPRYVVENELKNGLLKELKTDLTDKKITAICIYHKNKLISPSLELFIKLLKENFQQF